MSGTRVRAATHRVWVAARVGLRLWLAGIVLSAIALAISGFIGGRNVMAIGAHLKDGEGRAPSALPLKLVRPLWWLGTNQPGVQVLRLIPGAQWVPQSLSAVSASWSAVTLLADEALRASRAIDDGIFNDDGTFDQQVVKNLAENSNSMSDAIDDLVGLLGFLEQDRGPMWRHPARSALVQELWEAHRAARDGLQAIRATQPLLTNDSPRAVFVGITNPAEARSVHGIIGQYAVVELSQDGIEVREIDSNLVLKDPPNLPSGLSEGYEDFYGANNSEWQNMTLSPFVDDAAEQIAAAWKLSRNQNLDGVVLIDTVALARLATAAGNTYMTAEGRLLSTAQGLSDYLSNGVYLEFPLDNLERKEFQTALGRRIVETVLDLLDNPRQLVPLLTPSLQQGRFAMWVRNSTEQLDSGQVVIGLHSERLPAQAAVVRLNNYSGNKMDFYLQPSITVARCAGEATISLKFENRAPRREDLPDYVLRRLDPIGGDPGSFVGLSITVGQHWEVTQWSEDDGGVESRLSEQLWGQRLRVWLDIPIGASRVVEIVLAPRRNAVAAPSGEAQFLELDLAPMAMAWSTRYSGC